MNIIQILKDAAYNRSLYRKGQANKNEIHLTTIGWRPDPMQKNDEFIKDKNPSSRNDEYYQIIRKK